MGMFDSVNFSTPCPSCGAIVDGFQSKDGPCELLTLEPEQVSTFYSHCRSCGREVEFSRLIVWDVEPRAVPLDRAAVEALGFRLSAVR
jgi:hypothetical protein